MNSFSNYNPQIEAGDVMRAADSRRRAFLMWPVFWADAWRMTAPALVFFYLLLPSLLSFLSIRLLNALPHGIVNLEILAIAAVGVFLPRWLVFLLLLADLLADCAYSICYTYQFSVSDLFESLRFLSVLPGSRLIAGCAVVGVVIFISVVLALVRPRPQQRMRTACALAAVAAVLLPIDMLSGQNPLWHQDVSLLSGRVTRSPILTLGVRALFAHRTELSASHAQNEPMASASAQMTPWLTASVSAAERPDVVLIVVESWGLPLDSYLAQALTAPYASAAIAHSYRVSYGTAPFTGLTVPGEARELCLSTMGFGILHPSAQVAQRCLPGQFHALGYENIALHGYVGEMFYRAQWYRELGFDRALFGPELGQIGLRRCGGAFPGICDGAIARFIGDSLLDTRQAQPKFIYWVTLNSHLPVPARPDLPADDSCTTDPALRSSAALCSWFRLVRAVHQSVSQVAVQTVARTAARPTVFILVGDHAPPFGDPRLRSRFSASQVPYVMLTPVYMPLH